MSKRCLTIEFQDKDGVYGNFLLYSNQLYPCKVNTNGKNSTILLNGYKGITASYDPEQFLVTYQAESLSILRETFETLRWQRIDHFNEGMRQQTALMALSEEVIDMVKLQELQIHGRSGGLGIDQVQAVLNFYFAEDKKIYVPSSMAYESLKALDWNVYREYGVESVIFSFEASSEHQVGVHFDLRQQKMLAKIYDSFEKEFSEDNRQKLRVLLGVPELEIVKGESPYLRQIDDWSCGVHVIENLRHAVSERTVETKSRLSVSDLLAGHYQRAKWWLKTEEKEQEQRKNNYQTKRNLLGLIEKYRDENGANQDIFKQVADLLQNELWGNVDRQGELETNEVRNAEVSYRIQSRSINELLESHLKSHLEPNLESNSKLGRTSWAVLYVASLLQGKSSFEEDIKSLLLLLTGNEAVVRGTHTSNIDAKQYANEITVQLADAFTADIGFINDAHQLTNILAACLDVENPFEQVMQLIDVSYPTEKANYSQLRHSIIFKVLNHLPYLAVNNENNNQAKSVKLAAYRAKRNALEEELKKKLDVEELPQQIYMKLDVAAEHIASVLKKLMNLLNAEESMQFLRLFLDNRYGLDNTARGKNFKQLESVLPVNMFLKTVGALETIQWKDIFTYEVSKKTTLFCHLKDKKEKLVEFFAQFASAELQELMVSEYFHRISGISEIVEMIIKSVPPENIYTHFFENSDADYAVNPILLKVICDHVAGGELNNLWFSRHALATKMIKQSQTASLQLIKDNLPEQQHVRYISEILFDTKKYPYYVDIKIEFINCMLQNLNPEEWLQLLRRQDDNGKTILHYISNSEAIEAALKKIDSEKLTEVLSIEDNNNYSVFDSIFTCQKVFEYISSNVPEDCIYEQFLPKSLKKLACLKYLPPAFMEVGLQAIREELLSPEQMAKFNSNQLKDILTEPGLKTLREELLNPEQMAKFNPNQLKEILTELGLKALRKELLNPEQMAKFNPNQLKEILTELGLKALRKELLNPEQMAKFNAYQLGEIFTEPALKVLREKLLSPEQMEKLSVYQLNEMPAKLNSALSEKLLCRKQLKTFSSAQLKYILTELTFQALRKELLTIEQMKKFDEHQLREILTEGGLKALREKLLSAEQMEKFSGAQLKEIFIKPAFQALWKELLTLEQMKKFDEYQLREILTEQGLKALREKLLSAEQMEKFDEHRLREILTEQGLKALREKLLSAVQMEKFSGAQLKEIFTNPPFRALREELLSLEQMEKFDEYQLREILTEPAFNALQEKLLSPEQMIKFNRYQLKEILTETGLQALQEKLLSPEQMIKFNDYQLKEILTETGLQALREKLLSPEQMEKLKPKQLEHILTETGFRALREELISLEQIAKLKRKQLEHIFTEPALQALREKLLSLEQIAKFSEYPFRNILTEAALQALREKLLSPDQLEKFRVNQVSYILTEPALQALRERLFSLDQFAEFSDYQLANIFTEPGLQALRERLLSPEQMKNFDECRLKEILIEPAFQALREGLLSLEQMGELDSFELRKILTESGLKALRDKLPSREHRQKDGVVSSAGKTEDRGRFFSTGSHLDFDTATMTSRGVQIFKA